MITSAIQLLSLYLLLLSLRRQQLQILIRFAIIPLTITIIFHMTATKYMSITNTNAGHTATYDPNRWSIVVAFATNMHSYSRSSIDYSQTSTHPTPMDFFGIAQITSSTDTFICTPIIAQYSISSCLAFASTRTGSIPMPSPQIPPNPLWCVANPHFT